MSNERFRKPDVMSLTESAITSDTLMPSFPLELSFFCGSSQKLPQGGWMLRCVCCCLLVHLSCTGHDIFQQNSPQRVLVQKLWAWGSLLLGRQALCSCTASGDDSGAEGKKKTQTGWDQLPEA
ncbi:uncharacterized protein LOC144320748 [Canis aureus]